MTESVILPPETKKIDHSEKHHGIIRHDYYHWLRAKNWQEVFKQPELLDPAIRQHLDKENAYQKAQMADTTKLQQQLFSEMKGRIKEDDSSVPVKDGSYAYGVSFVTGGEQPRYFRTPRNGGEATIYLDGDALAKGKDYFRLGTVQHSPDHSKCVWCYDDKGSEFYTIKLRDMALLSDRSETIENTSGDVVWDANSEGFFYTSVDENHRPSKLYYHKLGTGQQDDLLIFEEKDPGFFLGVGGSSLNDVIYIEIHDHETSEVWLIHANKPTMKP